MGSKTIISPPEGVAKGESIPRENEVEGQEIYEKMKEKKVEEMKKRDRIAKRAEGGGDN